MTGYSELAKALTCGNDGKLPCHNNECPYWVDQWHGIGLCNVIKKDADAADAIEELKDMPWVESVQVDKLRQRIDELEETACHCNVRENAELIAKILDDDVDGKVYQMPKRGEWIFDGKFMELHKFHCSNCKRTEFRMSDYCPNCGADMRAKMEVQE